MAQNPDTMTSGGKFVLFVFASTADRGRPGNQNNQCSFRNTLSEQAFSTQDEPLEAAFSPKYINNYAQIRHFPPVARNKREKTDHDHTFSANGAAHRPGGTGWRSARRAS
jgi:hypothetical protein